MKQTKYQQPLGLSFGEKIVVGILILPMVWNLSNLVLYPSPVLAVSNPPPAEQKINCTEAMAFGDRGQTIKEIFDLTNQDRQKNNLPKLCYSQALAQAAQGKVDDMAAKGYFAHINPQGKNMEYWISKSGGNEYYKIGENLAVNFWDAGVLEKAWMNSPDSCMRIVTSSFCPLGNCENVKPCLDKIGSTS